MTRLIPPRTTVALFCAAAFVTGEARAQSAPTRPMRVDDLFTIEEYRGHSVSPDGEWIAVVLVRPQSEREIYQRDFLQGNDHADVWLVPRRGGTPRNITNGLADAAGFWAPLWSPDGARLAMMSTRGGAGSPRGGDNVRVWVWEREGGKLTLASPRPLDLPGNVELSGTREGDRDGFASIPFAWTGPTSLLLAAIPDSMVSLSYSIEHRTQRTASRAWPEAERGNTATVSVLETGSPRAVERPRLGMLIRLDLDPRGAARERMVTSLSLDGQARRLLVSPNMTSIAIAEGLAPPSPVPDTLLNLGARSGRSRLGIQALEGSGGTWWIDSLETPASMAWSPTGDRLAITAAAKPGVLVLTPAARSVSAMGGRVTVSRAVWGDDVLFAHGVGRRTPGAPASAAASPGWWRLWPGDSAVLMTPGARQVGPQLVRLGNTLVALVDSAIQALDPGGAALRSLAPSGAPKVATLLGPVSTRGVASGNVLLVEGVPRAQGRALYRVTTGSGSVELQEVPKPHPKARVASWLPGTGLALFTTAASPFPLASDGPQVWLSSFAAAGPVAAVHREIFSLNKHLGEIVEAERRFIPYRGIEGDSLLADVLLPVGYTPGKRYPLLVHVYAGSVVRDTLEPRLRYPRNSAHPLNYQIFAARGYIVMTPSMPLSPDGTAKDPYMELLKGVMPAVDKLIDLGIADPARLGVFGQSFGGFSTFGLMTLTNRFKAAASLAGIANWQSLYGAFDPRSRYDGDPQNFFAPGLLETGQVSLGATPWRDLWKYLRNSPIHFFDRVSTPVLIIQGDVDYVTMAQGEEAYTALQRLGKRARFVRYWGEGHVLNSPANIRDMWKEMLAWFDELLVPKETLGGSSPR